MKKNNTPYQVFTPFKNFCLNNLKVNELNELLFATEEEIIQYYKKIRQYNLN